MVPLHLFKLLSVLAPKLLLECFHILAVFLAHLRVELGKQTVREVSQQDLLLLFDLFVVQVGDVLDLALLGPLLHLLVDLLLFQNVRVFDIIQVLFDFLIDVFLLLLELLQFFGLVSPRDDGIDTTLPIRRTLAEFLLLRNLLLHHSEHLFFKLDTFLLVQLKE